VPFAKKVCNLGQFRGEGKLALGFRLDLLGVVQSLWIRGTPSICELPEIEPDLNSKSGQPV
jgi:hypothetical protein